MAVTYEPIDNLPFYSLLQFRQVKTLSNTKSPVSLYQHLESHQTLVVKDVPYRQQCQKIYQILSQKAASASLITIRGISLMRVKIKQKRSYEMNPYMLQEGMNFQQRKTTQPPKQNKEVLSLIIFMEPCQCNLKAYIQSRRDQRKPFKLGEISQFLSQMLIILSTLEEDNISHRDIKPENILYDHGKFRLCDFDDSTYLDPLVPADKRGQLDITTLAYTSPEFYRNLKEKKKKLFDPFKLDLYAMGITLLYMCSLGRFNLKEREEYLKGELYQNVHSNFIKEQRRKYIKNNEQLKGVNSIVKMMLEEDEYKRDTFITLLQKVKPMIIKNSAQKNQIQMLMRDERYSENSRSEDSHKENKRKDKEKWKGTTELQRKSLISLFIFCFSFFILLFIL